MALPNGVYRISQWGAHDQPQILTLQNDQVTLTPPGGAPESDQEWRLVHLPNGNVAIQNPADIFPSRSLSYEGEPEEGKQVIPGPVSDFPTREWRVEPAPQLPLPVPYFIRVPDSDLVVEVSPARIFPPQLRLGRIGGLDKAWVFELVGPK